MKSQSDLFVVTFLPAREFNDVLKVRYINSKKGIFERVKTFELQVMRRCVKAQSRGVCPRRATQFNKELAETFHPLSLSRALHQTNASNCFKPLYWLSSIIAIRLIMNLSSKIS